MLTCEGYKMFDGVGRITPKNGREPFEVVGTWLFKPDDGLWYVSPTNGFPWGASFPADVFSVVSEARR